MLNESIQGAFSRFYSIIPSMDIDITPIEPIQLTKGEDGKVIVPAVTAKTPAIMPDGRACNIYPDGAVRAANGQLMVAHPKLTPITADNALDMVKRKQLTGVERALAGMQLAADDLHIPISEPAELWTHIIRKQALRAVNKGHTDAARLVGQAAKQLPERASQDAEQPAAGHSVDVDALIRLGQAMDREVARRVAEAQAVDGVVVQSNDE